MQYVLACSCVAVELERALKYGGCNDHTYQLYYIFTDYASNNARKKITYYAGSSARILAASLDLSFLIDVLTQSHMYSACVAPLMVTQIRSELKSTVPVFLEAFRDVPINC